MKTNLYPYCYLVAFTLCFPVYSDAAIYRWVDENGEVHFSDKDPRDHQSEKIEIKDQSRPQPKPNSSRKTSPTSQDRNREPDTSAILAVKLPEQPTKEQVAAYIQEIYALSRGQRTYLRGDPQVMKLAAIGSENADVLISLTNSNVSWMRYGVYALEQIATDVHKSQLIDAMHTYTSLVSVVYKNNWEKAAEKVLVSVLRDKPKTYLPSDWLHCVVRLKNRNHYPLLVNYLIHGWNRHSTYSALKQIPGLVSNSDLIQAWENAFQDNNKLEVGYLLGEVVSIGHLPAFEYAVKALDEEGPHSGFDPRQLVLRYSDAEGSDLELKNWYRQNKRNLVFDSQLKKYRATGTISRQKGAFKEY